MVQSLDIGTTNACGHFFDDRSRKLLTHVWNSLQEQVRSTFNSYWDDPENHWLLNGPIFALTDRPVNKGAHGSTDFHGFLLRFHLETITNSDDKLVKDLFAHELAHAYYYASGDRDKESAHETSKESTIVREKYANRLMIQWGYDVLPDAPLEHRP